MNDRTSAAPPAQFLGPEQLKDYENQFYAEPPKTHETRRPRPFSASGQLQVPRNGGMQELQQPSKHTVAHKKSMGFFGRVRDALFHRGGGHHGPAALKEQDVHRKHSSLQEPLQRPHMPPPPRPEFLQHEARTRSEVNIAQMFSDPTGGVAGDRPSREEILASYNQLVASGFFQSHAIQSTRHAAPTSAAGGRQPPVLPMDPQAAPRPPMRLSSMHKTARPSSVSPMPAPAPSVSPNPQSRNSREYTATAMGPPAAPRTSLSSLFRPSFSDLNTKDSRYTLRGRKRTRDETPVTTPEPQSSSSTSYFTEPLKRVAKKLREMPSTSSQLNEKATATKNNNNTVYIPQGPSDDTTSADGIMRLVPSISTGGSLYPNDRPIRLRSPSPAVPETTAAERRSERPVREPVISAATRARRPRKTFSYTVTESTRARTRAAEREQRSKLQRRGSSPTRADDPTTQTTTPRSTRQTTTTTTHAQNPLGQWQRVSLENTMIHRDSSDSTQSQWDWEWEQRQSAEVRIASSPGNGNGGGGGGGNKATKAPRDAVSVSAARHPGRQQERPQDAGALAPQREGVPSQGPRVAARPDAIADAVGSPTLRGQREGLRQGEQK
ncbi:hypothetical protein CIB48_g3761 [Xylaria polymorpha]|nr:hypothetical protein CIB48_g3761 [Xylaria polymorpha]